MLLGSLSYYDKFECNEWISLTAKEHLADIFALHISPPEFLNQIMHDSLGNNMPNIFM